MRKFLVLILVLLLNTPPSYALFGGRKPAADDGRGYVGTLPDLGKSFNTTEEHSAKPVFEKTEKFHSGDALKPIPREDPSFVNIILKSDKTSEYINDLNEMIPVLERILDSIEEHEPVQRFVARVYFLNKNVDYLRNKYAEKPESSFISFQKLQEISSHAQTVSNLRAEAEKYKPYLAYGGAGYIYNNNNIEQQLEYLRIEIEEAIVVLKEAE